MACNRFAISNEDRNDLPSSVGRALTGLNPASAHMAKLFRLKSVIQDTSFGVSLTFSFLGSGCCSLVSFEPNNFLNKLMLY
ncbi:MAG TPA: hypothetical protein ENI01_06215 [Maribacter sp.]|nr:hypothetical protein [Maribacter sp.]